MSKIVFDSDGLIKLEKAGLLDLLADRYHCLVPEAVYKETVIKGKKGLYEDAFEIEEIVEEKIDCIKVEETDKAKKILEIGDPTSLGQGEKRALGLYFQEEGDVVLSDDRTFLNLLARHEQTTENIREVPFLTPANVIVEMARKGIISSEQAREGLNRIKGLIRESSYRQALQDLDRGD